MDSLRSRPPLPWEIRSRRPDQVLCRHVDLYILSLARGPEKAVIVSYKKGAKFLDFVTGGEGKWKFVASDDGTLHAR